MLLLGIDVGTSSIKVSIVDSASHRAIVSVQYPDAETPIISLKEGWAEQSPDEWLTNVKAAILKANKSGSYNPKDIGAIGIAYQMHGLVLVDKERRSIRNSIIWCDSRAVPYGDAAFDSMGKEWSLQHLLNSPGNFTAAKLAWVKENEPAIFDKIDKIMLPGDYIALKLTGSITSSASSLSEGIFWDFKANGISQDVLRYFQFSEDLIPTINPVFSNHGQLLANQANELGLMPDIPVSYKAGDQPNNALSLNVLKPGEVAATAGTSGVIYGVSDRLVYDKESRLNSFAHVNHTSGSNSIGVLLCINGCGIMNRFVRQLTGNAIDYKQMNNMAGTVPVGADGLCMLPFGNGAERMLNNKLIGAHIHNIDLNIHTSAHFYRAAQEGIAFAFRYGFDIMKENGLRPSVIKAGKANMFLSDVFTNAFVNVTGVPVELMQADGAVGAALGAGIGVGIFTEADMVSAQQSIGLIEPAVTSEYEDAYQKWVHALQSQLV